MTDPNMTLEDVIRSIPKLENNAFATPPLRCVDDITQAAILITRVIHFGKDITADAVIFNLGMEIKIRADLLRKSDATTE